jgi:DNA (cytosine-5)-methyltransferase 1
MPNLQQYLTVKDAAAFVGVTANTIRNWGREAKIPEYRHPVNNYRLYKRGDLQALLDKTERSRKIRRKAK